MQICEYFFENACYSVTKYYLCKQNNKRSLLGRKQQSQVARSFPNRYLFSLTNKVTYLFPISCILEIIFARVLLQIARLFAANSPKSGANVSPLEYKFILQHSHATPFLHQNEPSRESNICGRVSDW